MSKQEALPPWAEIQKKTFTNWVNVHLAERDLKIQNLALDLSDGLRLINLLEQISAKRLPKYTKVVKFHNQKLENVGIALKFLKDEGLKLVAIGPEDVVECRIKLILGLIWTIILRWQIQKISYNEGSPGSGEKGGDTKAELLGWVNKVIPKNPVKNLNKDWQDGKALAALTNYLRPGSVPIKGDEEPLELITKAVTAAEQLKVPAVISPEDIISPHLDDLSMMTYVSMFREREAQIKVPDPTKFEAYGPGLTHPVAHKKNKFVVVAKNSEGDRLGTGGLLITSKFAPKAHLKQSEPHYHTTKVTDNRNGEYSLGYVPTSPGEYVIYVSWQEFEIAGSPFSVNVSEPTVISAEHSSVDPEPKGYVQADQYAPVKYYFLVTTRHSDGSPVTHGGAALVSVIDSGSHEVDSVIEDNNDGTYKIVFSEPAEGEYTVAIGLAGNDGEQVLEHVSGSPFLLEIAPGYVGSKQAQHQHTEPAKEKPKKIVVTINPKKSVVEKQLLSKPNGKKYFRVITKDDSGAQVYVPNVRLRAQLSPVTKGPYYLISRLNHLVLTLPENKNTPNEYVLTWSKKTGNQNQLWYFTPEGGIENAKTGLVLDVSSDGTRIVVQHKKARAEQGWHYNPVTEIFTSSRPPEKGRSAGNFALDIQHAKKQPGTNLVIFAKRHPNSNKSQRWYLNAINKAPQAAPPPTVATFYIVSRLHQYVLGASKPTKEHGVHVVLLEKKPSSDPEHTYQLWKFTPDGFVQNVATGYVLDLEGDPGENVKLILAGKKPKDNTNQKWKYNPITELLESDKEESFVVNVDRASKDVGTHAVLLPRKTSKSPSQHWFLVPSSKGDNAIIPNLAAHVPVDFVDHKDGTYDVEFVPEVAGKYDVSVGLAGDDTPGEEEGPIVHFEHSPFVTEINPATEVSPANSFVATVPKVLPNGDRVFEVNLKDKDGNKIPFSGVPIVANITAKKPDGKEVPVAVTIVDKGDGVYDVVLKPTAGSGPYHVDVGLPKDDEHPNEIGVHIGNAPFDAQINLADGVDPSKSTVDKHPVARLDSAPSRRGKGSRKQPSAKDLGKGKHKKDDDKHKHGHDDDKPKHGHGDDDKHGHGHGDDDKPKHGHGHGDDDKPKHGHGDDDHHKHGHDDDKHGHGHGHGDDDKHKHGDDDKHKHGHDDDKHKHGDDDKHKHGHDDDDKHKHGHDDGDDKHKKGKKPKKEKKDKKKKQKKDDDTDSSSSSSSSSSSDSDSDGGKKDRKKKEKKEKKPKHGKKDEGDKPTVTRVWKARAKDADGNPVKFGGAPVAANAKNADGASLPVTVEDNNDGTYDVVVSVPTDDDLVPVTLEVGLGDKLKSSPIEDVAITFPFHGTPFDAKVDTNDATATPEAYLELDLAPKFSRKTNSPYFVVRSKDKHGHPLKRGGLPVVAHLANLDDIPADLEEVLARLADSDDKEALLLALQHSKPIPLTIKDKKDGTYRIVLNDPTSGDFVLDLGLGDPSSSHPNVVLDRTKDLPVLVSIDLGDSDALGDLDITKSEADLSTFGEDQLSDGSIYFPVTTKDSNGEPIPSGGAPLAAVVTVAGRQGETEVPAKVIDNGDGTYFVSFVPEKLPGTYSIAVGLEDDDGHVSKDKDNQIKDFPILVKLGPGVDDKSSPLAQAADQFLLKPELKHQPEDGEGGIGFDIVPKAGKAITPELLEALGASFAALILDDDDNVIPAKITDLGDGKTRVSFQPKPNQKYAVGVALVDDDNNAAEIAGSPFLVAVGPDGAAEIVVPPEGFQQSAGDDDDDGPAVVRKGGAPTQSAATDSPFNQKASPYHTLPQKPKYAKAIEAPSPHKTTIDGPGLRAAAPQKEATFTIHPKSENGTPLTGVSPSLFKVKAKGPDGDVRVKLTPNDDGTLTAAYTPKVAGPLKLDVEVADPSGKFHEVHGSPVEIDVEPAISAQQSKISGAGIDNDEAVVTGQRSFFTIRTYDKRGNPVTVGGEKFHVKIDPPSLLSAAIALFVHPEVIDNNDGTYTVWYTPRDSGKHTINVKHEGNHVGASPIAIEVEEGTDEAETLAVDYMFTIEARTIKGIPRNRGGDKFVVAITGPEGPVTDVKVEDLAHADPPHPGKYRVWYTLPGAGKYVIKATINGKDIKGSPWRQKL